MGGGLGFMSVSSLSGCEVVRASGCICACVPREAVMSTHKERERARERERERESKRASKKIRTFSG